MRHADQLTRPEAAALLGLAEDADPATVRHAWRMWVRLAHPDVGGDPAHFVRLEQARRVLLQPLPVTDEPRPRAAWSSVVDLPQRPLLLALTAAATVLLALVPMLLADPAQPRDLALAAVPAAVAAVAWAAWASREILNDHADRGHRIAMLAALWVPIAVAQEVTAAVAGVSLLSVLPVLALPLVATVGVMNAGAGLWRPISAPRA